MPSPLARLDGDITRLARGSGRHMAPSTSRPRAVSAVPYGRGSAWGSLAATPWAITGGGTGEPHPAMTIAASARPAAPRSWFFMRIRRRRTLVRLRADDYTEIKFPVTGDGSGAPLSTASLGERDPDGPVSGPQIRVRTSDDIRRQRR